MPLHAHHLRTVRRMLACSCVAVVLAASGGCLLFTSIDDLGGRTRPLTDASDDVAATARSDGGALDGGEGGTGQFGSSLVIARTAPGLRSVGVDATRVFFTNDDTGEVRSASKTGDGDGGSALLTSAYKPTDIAVDATRVYWIQNELDHSSNLSASFVYRSIKKDGTNLLDQGGDYFTSIRMTFAGGQVYTSTFTSSSQWGIRRDGLVLVQPTNSVAMKCVVSDGATVFYELGGVIHTYPEPDGGGPFATADATDLAVDDTSLYWITASGLLQSLDKGKRGQPPMELASGLSAATRIALDADSVYVTAWGIGAGSGRVVRVPKAGGPLVAIATGLAEPSGIAVDATAVYVANHGDGTVIAVPRL